MKKKLLFLTVIFIFIDQLSKFLIVKNLDVDTGFTIIPSFFSILYVRNTGAAWGIFSNGTIVLAVLSIFFLVFALKYIFALEEINNFKVVTYSLLFGGIVGNLIDRLVRNYVIDFLSFKIISYNFPVFNLADCFIVISIMLLLLEMILDDRKGRVIKNDSKGK